MAIMMMSREIIQRTLEHTSPERVARTFGDSDVYLATCEARTYATDWENVGKNRWERTDEWGNLWARVENASKGEVVKGVLDSLHDLDTYIFPDYSRSEEYTNIAAQRHAQPDKWLIGMLPGFTFNIARKMRKLDQYLMDLLTDIDQIRVLHDQIDVMLADMIRNYGRAGVDSVFFPEDWGTQAQTLISPRLWRQEFFPRFQNLCTIAREVGVKVFMHSCGKIDALVPGLIDAGIDVLQFDQPDLHGIDTLAQYQCQGKITFWCPVDIQTTLQQRNEQVIRMKVREMLDKLWQGRGGFIAGYYTDNDSIGLEPIWQEYACDEFLRYGHASRYANGKIY